MPKKEKVAFREKIAIGKFGFTMALLNIIFVHIYTGSGSVKECLSVLFGKSMSAK